MATIDRLASELRPLRDVFSVVGAPLQRRMRQNVHNFLPVRRYVSAGLFDSDVSVRPSVRLSVRLSHAGIVRSRAKGDREMYTI